MERIDELKRKSEMLDKGIKALYGAMKTLEEQWDIEYEIYCLEETNTMSLIRQVWSNTKCNAITLQNRKNSIEEQIANLENQTEEEN